MSPLTAERGRRCAERAAALLRAGASSLLPRDAPQCRVAGLDEVLARLLAATGAGVACVVDEAGALAAVGAAEGALDAPGILRLARGAEALAANCAADPDPAVREMVLGAAGGTHVLRTVPGSDLLLYAFVPGSGDVGPVRARLGAAGLRDDVQRALAGPPPPPADAAVTALVAAAIGLPRPRPPADPARAPQQPALATLGAAVPAARADPRPRPGPRRAAGAPGSPPLPRRAPGGSVPGIPGAAPEPGASPVPPVPDRRWARDGETMRRVLAGLRRLS